MITSTRVQNLIDLLRKVEHRANEPKRLDMLMPEVKDTKYECGTVHCFAGWALAASGIPQADTSDKYYYYRDGVDLITNILGVSQGRHVLQNWARDNPKLWGNYNGYCMFSDLCAFGLCESSENKMTGIINHFVKLRDRLASYGF